MIILVYFWILIFSCSYIHTYTQLPCTYPFCPSTGELTAVCPAPRLSCHYLAVRTAVALRTSTPDLAIKWRLWPLLRVIDRLSPLSPFHPTLKVNSFSILFVTTVHLFYPLIFPTFPSPIYICRSFRPVLSISPPPPSLSLSLSFSS